MSDPFLFVLLALGSFRLWRFIGRDEFALTAWPRRYAARRWGEGSVAHYWITCPWCAGAWVSALVVAVADTFYIDLRLPVLWWLAVSAAVGLLGGVLDGG